MSLRSGVALPVTLKRETQNLVCLVHSHGSDPMEIEEIPTGMPGGRRSLLSVPALRMNLRPSLACEQKQ